MTGPTNSFESGDVEVHLERARSEFVDLSDRFKLPVSAGRNFRRQYAHVYSQRLTSCRNSLYEIAKRKWGEDVPCRRLCEIVSGERCLIVGTLYKDMRLKPNILRELGEDQSIGAPPPPGKYSTSGLPRYTSTEDELILEDEVQRIFLRGEVCRDKLVTGVVVVVLGLEPEENMGKFFVEDIAYLELPAQPVLPSLHVGPQEGRYLALVSGLGLGGPKEDPLRLQLLVDSLSGLLGTEGDQRTAAGIVRVVLAGNSLSRDTQDKDKLAHQARYLSRKTAAGSVAAMSTLDSLVSQLASHMAVDLMPGEQDPGNFLLPQQPLHRVMFPKAARLETFRTVTNPYAFSLDGRVILGTAGQNIDDVDRYTDMDDSLDRLECLLRWGHLAPTAPDTLGCYPFHDEDPFLLGGEGGLPCPHVFFAGNQTAFACRRVEREGGSVLLVTVPRFEETGVCVLVDLCKLECRAMRLSAEIIE